MPRTKQVVETAHHEAGHAVAAWWYGQLRKRDYVTIIPNPDNGSLGHFRNPPRFNPEVDQSGRTILQAEKFVVGCLAGNAAACRYRKTTRRYLAGGVQDRERAVTILTYLAGGEELTAYFRLLQLRAENLVARFWPEVEALASRLLKEKRLTGEQIRETCLEARTRHHR